MKVATNPQSSSASITPGKRFDFNTHRDFRACYEQVVGVSGIHSILIDLQEVDYLDSSALGMLLLLKDKADNAGQNVELVNARSSVLQILEVANFGKLFQIR